MVLALQSRSATLRNLDLSDNGLDDEWAAALEDYLHVTAFPHLEHLHLKGNSLTEGTIAHL